MSSGLDIKSENCQRFIKDGMTISFNKIFLDDAVSTWKFEIHVSFDIFHDEFALQIFCKLNISTDLSL